MTTTTNPIIALLKPPQELGTGDPNEAAPGTGKSGPRGIESVIEYNGLFMNVREWIDTFLVTTIGGLEDADIRDSRELNPGYHGETQFEGLYGGRTITLSGKVITKTLFKLRDMQQAMRMAFADLSDEKPLYFRAPQPAQDSMIYCKKSQSIQMADEQRTANHFERAFLITLRASNPRFVSSIRDTSTRTFTAATYNAIAFTPLNNGNFEAQPEIELVGPFAAGLTFFNEASGNFLALTGAIPSGETWVIEVANHRLYRRSDMANRFMYLDVNSDWIELGPGNNPIRVTASGMTAGTSRINLYHRSTYM